MPLIRRDTGAVVLEHGRARSAIWHMCWGVVAVCLGGQLAQQRRAAAEASASAELAVTKAIALAVEHNPVLQAAGAQVAIAEARVLTSLGLDDFQFEARASVTVDGGQLPPGSPFTPLSYFYASGALALIRPLPTGGTLAVHLLGDYGKTVYQADGDRLRFNVYDLALQASFEQPLLRGASTRVARAERWRARADRAVVDATRSAIATTLMSDIVVAYWEFAYAFQELAIRERAAAGARDHLARVDANISAGKQPPSGIAEIEVALALREDAVLVASQNLANRRTELSRLCGIELPLTTIPQTALEAPTRSPEGALDVASAENPQLRAARLLVQATQVDLDVSKNALLPYLNVVLAAGPSVSIGNLNRLTAQLGQPRGYGFTAGLTLNVPLERRQALGQWRAAQAQRRKTQLDVVELANRVAAEVRRATVIFETARDRVRALVRSAEAAAVDLASVQALFETGRATNFDVLRRQDQALQVELVRQRAVADQLGALARLDALKGQLLAIYRVELRSETP